MENELEANSARRGSGVSMPINKSSNRPPRNLEKGFGVMDYYHQYPGGMPMYIQHPHHPILINPPPLPTYHYGIPPSPMMQYGLPPYQQRGPAIEATDDETGGGEFHYDAAPPPSDAGFDKGTFDRHTNLLNSPNFGSRISIRKGEGVTIEEVLDSASVHNYPVALINSNQDQEPVSKDLDTLSVLGKEQFSAAFPQRAPVRWRHSSTPINTIVMFVPQQEAWIVERMGKFNRILEPGLNVLIPILDKIKYVQSLKEIAIDIPSQSAITIDNVTLNIDGVLYLRVRDAYNASYGVEDPEFAITQLAQTTMRSEIGKITLDTLFRERDNMNAAIVIAINQASEAWGIQCLRYEIRDIRMPARVQEAMQMQVEAERKKRAAILESEGIKTAEINVAEGKKQAKILESEAEKQQLINEAHGQAEAVIAAGSARAQSIQLVSKALGEVNGSNAAALAIAEKYVSAFGNLARTNNTLILPSNTGDVSSMVAQSLAIYQNLQKQELGQTIENQISDSSSQVEGSQSK